MIPAYIIHNESSIERNSIVEDLIKKTGAKVIPAIMLDNRVLGCTLSHKLAAVVAREEHPDEPYIVFEDDCVLHDNWQEIVDYHLQTKGETDIFYLGYTSSTETNVFGTHALYISPKARDVILKKTNETCTKVQNACAFDWILSKLSIDHNLTVTLPFPCNKYCHQATGLQSLITDCIR